jgi:hypothetical protein
MIAWASLPFLDRDSLESSYALRHQASSRVDDASLCLWHRRRRRECTYHSAGMMWSQTSNVVEDKRMEGG